MMAMPAPTDHHKKLHRLAGTWFGEEKLSPSPWGPGGQASGRYTYRVDIDGFFVIQEYLEEREGRVVFKGHGVLGWDDSQQTYTWYWVDSMGQVPSAPSRGTWKDDALIFELEPAGSQRGRYTYRFVDEDTYHFKVENSQDSGATWRTFMEGIYQRQ